MNLAALLAIAVSGTTAPEVPAEPAPEAVTAPSETSPEADAPAGAEDSTPEGDTPDSESSAEAGAAAAGAAAKEAAAKAIEEAEEAAKAAAKAAEEAAAAKAAEEAAEPAEDPVEGGETLTIAQGDEHPQTTEADIARLRERHGVSQAEPDRTDGARWKCLIADPTCGRTFEINALAAYSYRGRQGDVSGNGDDPRWNSGRAQYDFWLNIPVITDVRRRTKYTRMTMGPKAGVILSDSGSTWGNLGMAFRYWFSHKRWSPTLEFTSALSFKIGERTTRNAALEDPTWKMTRGPVGFTADVGVGLGGFGAIVLGGQYDSPLAREDVPEQFRVSAGGAFFIGFRGNILWGGPAAAAVATHAITQRTVEAP